MNHKKLINYLNFCETKRKERKKQKEDSVIAFFVVIFGLLGGGYLVLGMLAALLSKLV